MRYSIYLFLVFNILILLEGCSDNKTKKDQLQNNYIQVDDDLGRTVSINLHNQRIISLTPSITELLYAFSDTTHIVGRSIACDYPEEVQFKPAVNNYPVDIEAIVRLKPDLVFVKMGMIPMVDLEKLRKLTIPVFVQKYDRLDEIEHSIRTLVRITNGDSVKMNNWLNELNQKSLNQEHTSQTFIAIASATPIYTFGQKTFVSELAESAGGKNVIDSNFNTAYPTVNVEYVLRSNPDIMIFESTEQQKTFFESYPVLENLSAYKNKKIYFIDVSLLSRPGSRLPVLKDSIETILNK